MDKQNFWDRKRLLIESIVAILCAVIGVAFGKASSTYYYNGQKITESDLNILMEENAGYKDSNNSLTIKNKELLVQIDQLTSEKNKLTTEKESFEKANKELIKENKSVKEQIADSPVIEFQNCGLFVDGEEKTVNKDKSYAVINGRQYYSREFFNTILPDNMTTTMKNETLYVGKIIKEKIDLLNLPVISGNDWEYRDSINDTYGNMYASVLYFKYCTSDIVYNAGREYSNFRCIVGLKNGVSSTHISGFQIQTDNGKVIYTSPEITSLTEPFEIDIPINQTSTITFKAMGSNPYPNSSAVFLANAVLYNQE